MGLGNIFRAFSTYCPLLLRKDVGRTLEFSLSWLRLLYSTPGSAFPTFFSYSLIFLNFFFD